MEGRRETGLQPGGPGEPPRGGGFGAETRKWRRCLEFKGGREKERGRAWEMKLEAKRRPRRPGEEPPPAGWGGGSGSAPPGRPAGSPTRPLGRRRRRPAPGCRRLWVSRGWPAQGGGWTGVGTWPPWARPEVPAARTPTPFSARRRGRQVGERGLCPEGPGSLCPANLYFSLPFFNRAGVGPL